MYQFATFTKPGLYFSPASWLTPSDLCDLEAATKGLLHHLVVESTPDQFDLLLLMIREALNPSQLRAGSYRVRWPWTSPDSHV